MISRQIRLKWNAGSGEASVYHPMLIEDAKWYGVTVNRSVDAVIIVTYLKPVMDLSILKRNLFENYLT